MFQSPFEEEKPSWLWRVVRVSFFSGLGIAAMAAFALFLWASELGVFAYDESTIRPILERRIQDRTTIFDRRGRILAELYEKHHVFVPIAEIPEPLIQAVLATEDRNFREHDGVDPIAIARASWALLQGGRTYSQGASTITQQVVRTFLLSNEKSFTRKVKEIALALHLEKHLDKDRILEIYLNNMFLGNGSYGVASASQRYFGKELKDLSLLQAAVIAGLFQSPSRLAPHINPDGARTRAKHVLRSMTTLGMISADEAEAAGGEDLACKEFRSTYGSRAPYFVDYVQNEIAALLPQLGKLRGKGLKVYTTLDPMAQSLMERVAAQSQGILMKASAQASAAYRYSSDASKGNPVELAMVSVHPGTGQVLAMLGGSDYKQTKYNRVFQSVRSPGSAFKPILFAEALRQGFKWNDLMYISPVNIDGYQPKDLGQEYLTETTLLRAFYRSVNSVAIELALKLGMNPVLQLARRMGIQSPLKDEVGTVIGGSGVTLMDMARVYSVFASGGISRPITAITKVTDQKGSVLWEGAASEESKAKRALEADVNYLMVEGMRSVLKHGTAYAASGMSNIAVGKTGTSDHSVDNWFCGFTSNNVLIVWVGSDGNQPLAGKASGSALALPVWQSFMHAYAEERPPKAFVPPENIASMFIHPTYGGPAREGEGVKMWFRKSELPTSAGVSPLEDLSMKRSYRELFNR